MLVALCPHHAPMLVKPPLESSRKGEGQGSGWPYPPSSAPGGTHPRYTAKEGSGRLSQNLLERSLSGSSIARLTAHTSSDQDRTGGKKRRKKKHTLSPDFFSCIPFHCLLFMSSFVLAFFLKLFLLLPLLLFFLYARSGAICLLWHISVGSDNNGAASS